MLSNIIYRKGILLWWFVISTSSGVFASELFWKRDKAFDDVLPNRVVRGRWSSGALLAESLLDCGQRCAQDVSCNTFFYNYVTGGCLPWRVLFEEPRGSVPKSTPGWRGSVRKSAPGWRYYKLASDEGTGYVSDRRTGVQYRLDRTSERVWAAGRVRCYDRGEDLAVLEPAKARFITHYFAINPGLNINRDVNIGAKFLNMDGVSPLSRSDFIWLNSRPMDFSGDNFWAPGQPPLGKVIESGVVVIGPRSENFTWKIAPFFDKNRGRYALCERPFLN